MLKNGRPTLQGNQIGEITKRNMALRKQLDAIERTLIARASATVE